MNNLKQWVLCLVLAIIFLNQGYSDDLNIPQGKNLDRLIGFMMNRRTSFSKEDQNFFGFNKEPVDWIESDFEALRTALKNEVTTNTNRYPTDAAGVFLKGIDEGINKMKEEQRENQQQLAKNRQQEELYNKIGQLRARIEPFLKKAYAGVISSDDILSSNELAQIKAVETEYQEIKAYAKQHDIRLHDQFESDIAKIWDHQNTAMALYDASELQKRETKHTRRVAFVAAAISFVMSIVVYFALHRRKVKQKKSRIEFLTVLEDGSTLAEEKQAVDREAELQDAKWKTLRPQIVKHLIEEYKPIIGGDARAIILESITTRIKAGVDNFQSFLPPSVRLPANHYAPLLFTEADVEKFKNEQNNIAKLLEEELEPDYENEAVVWVGDSQKSEESEEEESFADESENSEEDEDSEEDSEDSDRH